MARLIAYICLVMLLLSPLRCKQPDTIDSTINIPELPDTILRHIEYIRANIGVPEKDSIDRWLASVGLASGNPWCSALASYALDVAEVQEPDVRSGLARNFVYHTDNHISASKVLRGEVTAKRGWMVVYQRGNTIYGHNGFITEDWTGPDGVYISGNTSPPSGGSEFSGGGVWEKAASIRPGAAFRITDFVIIKN